MYQKTIGSRAEVFHGTAIHTSGGLKKKDLFQDKHGNIKSKKSSLASKRSQNLGSYKLPKGSHKFIAGGKQY